QGPGPGNRADVTHAAGVSGRHPPGPRMPDRRRGVHHPVLDPGWRRRQLADERAPGAGPHPAHVGHQRPRVLRREEALVSQNLDYLAGEKPAADRTAGDTGNLSLLDPALQLVVVPHQLVEVRTPEPRDVALERARIRGSTAPHRAVAAEAAEV